MVITSKLNRSQQPTKPQAIKVARTALRLVRFSKDSDYIDVPTKEEDRVARKNPYFEFNLILQKYDRIRRAPNFMPSSLSDRDKRELVTAAKTADISCADYVRILEDMGSFLPAKRELAKYQFRTTHYN